MSGRVRCNVENGLTLAVAVTTSDIRGTALIVFGVILIVVFSSINHGLRQDLPIEE